MQGDINLLSDEEVKEIIFWHFRRNFRSQKEAAKHYGCNNVSISQIQTCKKKPTKRMQEDMGIRVVKITGFVKSMD